MMAVEWASGLSRMSVWHSRCRAAGLKRKKSNVEQLALEIKVWTGRWGQPLRMLRSFVAAKDTRNLLGNLAGEHLLPVRGMCGALWQGYLVSWKSKWPLRCAFNLLSTTISLCTGRASKIVSSVSHS